MNSDIITDNNGRIPQAAMNIMDEKLTIGIQLYAVVLYPNEVMYEYIPKINNEIPVPNADAVSRGLRPILSTKL